MRALRITGLTLALTALVASASYAQGTNEYTKLSYLTFSGPVQIPGATLPAGTYTFRMADTTLGSAHIVQVLSRDGKKVFSSFFAIPHTRAETPEDTIVMFAERPAGAAQAIRIWYYPGNSTGEEFIYQKHDAMLIAKANHMPVLSSDDDTSTRNAKVARIDESGASSTADVPPVAVVAEAQPPQQPAPLASTTTTRRTSLPRTGSEFGLIALLSALSLAGALGVRRVRTRQDA
jgi:hypothetical protein